MAMFSESLTIAAKKKIEMELPDKSELVPIERELVERLENLLVITYPKVPSEETVETTENPEVKDIAKMLIAYYYMRFEDRIGDTKIVLKRLSLPEENLSPPFILLQHLESGQTISDLCSYGLMDNTAPSLAATTSNAHPDEIYLIDYVTKISIHAKYKVSYVVIADDVVQTQFIIDSALDIKTGFYKYDLEWTIGRRQLPSPILSAADPFKAPANLCFIVYNARGGNLFAFKLLLRVLAEYYSPMVIIVTETREKLDCAQKVAAKINFPHVVALEPDLSGGGVWVMSNNKHLLIRVVARTSKRLRINFEHI